MMNPAAHVDAAFGLLGGVLWVVFVFSAASNYLDAKRNEPWHWACLLIGAVFFSLDILLYTA